MLRTWGAGPDGFPKFLGRQFEGEKCVVSFDGIAPPLLASLPQEL